MRANKDAAFSTWLLQMGNGELITHPDISPDAIPIPIHHYAEEGDFISRVFDTEAITSDNVSQYYKTAILCPKNDHCDKINDFVVTNLVQGQSKIYLSCDSVELHGDDQQLYPTEFLNSLTPSGLPPHKLELKRILSSCLSEILIQKKVSSTAQELF